MLAAVLLAGAGCDSSTAPPAGLDAATGGPDGEVVFPDGPAADRTLPRDGAPADATAGDGGPPGTDAAGGDAAACTPTPFSPPGQPTGWKHLTTKLFVVTQGAANHRGMDQVAPIGSPQLLIGKFTYGPFDKDLKDEDVEIFVQKSPPCGPWVSLGVMATSEEGEYGDQYPIPDDGGRIYFTIPQTHTLPEGVYPVRMLVHGDHSVAKLNLFVVRPQTDAVVFDIDGTLTTRDFELITQLFKQLSDGSYVPEMRPDADAITAAWAHKGYLVYYLTGRPNSLTGITRDWLEQRSMPVGPLTLTNNTMQSLPTSGGVATYKTEVLKRLSTASKLSLQAAYGNATTDIEAYANAGIPKTRTYIIGDNAGKDGTQPVLSYTQHLPAVQAMPAAQVPAP